MIASMNPIPGVCQNAVDDECRVNKFLMSYFPAFVTSSWSSCGLGFREPGDSDVASVQSWPFHCSACLPNAPAAYLLATAAASCMWVQEGHMGVSN